MILRYGNYDHALAEAAVVIERSTLQSEDGVPYAVRERWLISGVLQAESQLELTEAIAALCAAYAAPAEEVSLRQGDGATLTAHRLRASDTLGGIRVVMPPSFPAGEGAEYSRYRSYRVVLEADVRLHARDAEILAWSESLEFSGGGPREVYLELRNGPPQRQTVSQETPFRVVQQGRAVGLTGYPLIATPLWPAQEDRPERRIRHLLPRTVGHGRDRTATEYEVTWSYSFHSATPLVGTLLGRVDV